MKIKDYLPERIRQSLQNSFIYPLYLRKVRFITPKLLSVHVEPTNICNLRCQVCYSQKPVLFPPREKGFMDFHLFRRIIDELSTFGYTMHLGLNFGGESLLHKNFVDMLAYASSKGVFKIGFTTNGTLLDAEIIEALIDFKIDNIVISIDALDEMHESLRVGSNYNTVKNNIIRLIEKRGSNPKPQISVNLTHSRQTHADILEFVNYWANIVDCVKIYPCLTEDIRFANPAFFDESPLQKEARFCIWPFYYLAILWNGDVTTCCADINGVNILGNITKQSIAALWKSKTLRLLRYSTVRNSFPQKPLCQRCEHWKFSFAPNCKHSGNIKVFYSHMCKKFEMQKTSPNG